MTREGTDQTMSKMTTSTSCPLEDNERGQQKLDKCINPVDGSSPIAKQRSSKASIDFATAYRVLVQAYVRVIRMSSDSKVDQTES